MATPWPRGLSGAAADLGSSESKTFKRHGVTYYCVGGGQSSEGDPANQCAFWNHRRNMLVRVGGLESVGNLARLSEIVEEAQRALDTT
jgi:hypothetical protein